MSLIDLDQESEEHHEEQQREQLGADRCESLDRPDDGNEQQGILGHRGERVSAKGQNHQRQQRPNHDELQAY